jgi:hypothetical protein
MKQKEARQRKNLWELYLLFSVSTFVEVVMVVSKS